MIRSKNITLRTIRESDLVNLFALVSEIENRGEYFPLDLPSEATFRKEYHEHGYLQDDRGHLLICAPENRIIGSMFYFKPTYFDALEIAYIVYDRESRGKGVMTEALTLLVKFLFMTKKINRIQLAIVPANVASTRVAEKCGFKYEGTARGALFNNGRNYDLEMYSVLRAEVSLP